MNLSSRLREILLEHAGVVHQHLQNFRVLCTSLLKDTPMPVLPKHGKRRFKSRVSQDQNWDNSCQSHYNDHNPSRHLSSDIRMALGMGASPVMAHLHVNES